MPEKAQSEPSQHDWAKQLERGRMRRVKLHDDAERNSSGASAFDGSAPLPRPTLSPIRHGSSNEGSWGRQLERQRLQMMKEHGPWLPGPGAAQAAVMSLGGLAGSGGEDKKKPELPMLMRAVTAFMPPQAIKEFETKGGKPLAEAIWKIHEIFVGSIKLIPFSLLTLGAFHGWWYAANFKGTKGLPKLGIGDLMRMLFYDGFIAFIVLLLLILMLFLFVIVYAISNPLESLDLISNIIGA